MIIREIKSNKRLFFGDRVLILTDKNKIYFEAEWEQSSIDDLNSRLKNFKIESANDFVSLKNKLKNLEDEKYNLLERAIFENIKKSWAFFNPAAKQVPRPMSIVLKKNSGIREFLIFSLNAKSFPIALEANRHVVDHVNKKIKDPENTNDSEIFMVIKEAIDSEHSLIEFELRVGVVFNNFDNGKYIYYDKNLNSEEQLAYISKLIDTYKLVYVENPFSESDLDSYKELLDKYRKKGLISMSSKIGEYSEGISKKCFNCIVVRFNNVADFKTNVDFLKEKKMNVVVDGCEEGMNPAVGLSVPLVKLSDNKIGDAAARKLDIISEEILSTSSSDKKP